MTTLADALQQDLFDVCAKRHKDNPLSESANRVSDKNRDIARIASYLKGIPDATCDEVEAALNMPHQTCSARFSDMKLAGEILPTTRRPTRTGCMAQAWRLNR